MPWEEPQGSKLGLEIFRQPDYQKDRYQRPTAFSTAQLYLIRMVLLVYSAVTAEP